MVKHTPGPWKINRTITHNYIGAGEQDRVTGHSYQCVAYNVVDEADAHLIAAAPDLLESADQALKAMIKLGNRLNWPGDIDLNYYADAINALREAITKATNNTD